MYPHPKEGFVFCSFVARLPCVLAFFKIAIVNANKPIVIWNCRENAVQIIFSMSVSILCCDFEG